jgi:membrane protein implicated in regulation of membrane protease activity
MRNRTPFSPQAWAMRLVLLAAVIAIFAGVPVWLEAVAWVVLAGAWVWVIRESRRRKGAN